MRVKMGDVDPVSSPRPRVPVARDPDPSGTYRALAALAHDGPVDGVALRELCTFADTRRDCSDFRLLVALKLAYACAGRIDGDSTAALRRTLLGFRYWMTAPGVDAMCFWSENHQLLFATCEYLAGALHPGEIFTSDRRTGETHRLDAEARLRRWLDLRFRFGFSEWLSAVYYEEDVAALSVLVDHAPSAAIAERATTVLDLLLLDVALHRFQGRFVASAGRLYERQKTDPGGAEMQLVADAAFGGTPVTPDWNQLGMLFALRDTYEVPAVLSEIADHPGTVTVRTSQGLDVDEAIRVHDDPLDPETTGALLWGMEAFVNPGAIRATMAAFRRWRLETNPFLSDLSAFSHVPSIALPALARVLNPVVQGTALQRADVQSHRTPAFLLSSAQHHQVGGFGDQQHLWSALLDGGIPLFTTHPGLPLVENATRQRTPDRWVGNGINPDLGQHAGVLLARYDTRGRPGYGEGPRARHTHLHLPTDRLDECELGGTRLVGRAGRSLLAVLGTSALLRVSDTEIVQQGRVTGWVVVLADVAEFGSLDAFSRAVGVAELDGRTLRAATPYGRYELSSGTLRHDGVLLDSRYPRYDCPWVQAPRDPSRIDVVGASGALILRTTGRAG